MKQITSTLTVKEFLNELNKAGNKVKPNLKSELTSDLLNAIDDKYPIQSSRGGAYYGLWFRLGVHTSISLKPKLIQTEKLKKVSATKRAYIWEFSEFKLDCKKSFLDKTLLELAKDLDRTGGAEQYFEIWDKNANEPSLENEVEVLGLVFKTWLYNFEMEITKDTKFIDIFETLIQQNIISRESGWWQTLASMSDFYMHLIGGPSCIHKFNLYSPLYKYEVLGDLTVGDIAKEILNAKAIVIKKRKY